MEGERGVLGKYTELNNWVLPLTVINHSKRSTLGEKASNFLETCRVWYLCEKLKWRCPEGHWVPRELQKKNLGQGFEGYNQLGGTARPKSEWGHPSFLCGILVAMSRYQGLGMTSRKWLLGKPTVEGKEEKEVAANQTERKNPKELGENQEKELLKEPKEKFLKNQEISTTLNVTRSIP